MRILFAGTPAFAVPALKALYATGKVAAVLTQPDRPQGRKGILTPSPVKVAAEELGLPVLQPQKLKEEFTAVRALGTDLMVTCAYGQILTQEVLDLFPRGVWNVHASLLPAYRGAAPIPRVIMDGKKETGITVMKTELGLDTGDILLKRAIPIEETDTAGTLGEKLSLLGAELIVEGIRLLEQGTPALLKQGEGFICKKVNRTEVDFSRTAAEVKNLIHALSPAPLAFATLGGQAYNFFLAEEVAGEFDAPCGTVLCASPKTGLLIACGKGAVKILELQPAGGKKMAARDFLNGRKLAEGMRFDQPVL